MDVLAKGISPKNIFEWIHKCIVSPKNHIVFSSENIIKLKT